MGNEELSSTIRKIFADVFEDNIIGSPTGAHAYAYVRVSSSGQAEEGRSGLPRQLMHIHDKARELGLAVPVELVFCDDHSGFDFRDRPGLQALLHEVSQPLRRADHVVIEYLDRLSRQAKWHQGYLLEQLQVEQRVQVHFWKEYNSEIERAVFGAMSEDGMRHEIERMAQGTRLKAASGRITAKTPAYGYQFADSEGRPWTDPASKYRKDTHYIPNPEQWPIVREIYERVLSGDSLYTICDDLNRRQVPTPKGGRNWETGSLSKLLKNPIYRGEYVANRVYFVKTWDAATQKMRRRQQIRPPKEWIKVPVPAVVTPEMWHDAQAALARNIKLSTRNAKTSFLLQGFLKCARCGTSFHTSTGTKSSGHGKRYFYGCGSRFYSPVLREKLSCHSPFVKRDHIDAVVWEAVCRVITEPDLIIHYLEEQMETVVNGGLSDQLAYIEREIKKAEKEERQWDRAFAEEIFTLAEYKDKKSAVAARKQTLVEDRERLLTELQNAEEFEAQKNMIRQHLMVLRDSGIDLEMPMEDRRRIMGLLVDRVVIDTAEGWFSLEGAVKGTYPLMAKDGDRADRTDFTLISAL